jgi:Mn2+/Fe2+ NRAMP family transporter
MHRTTKLLFNKELKYGYWFWILFLLIGTIFILKFFMDNMGLLVKTATILSFLTAPFYAILNYTLITGKHTPKKHQPGIFLRVLSAIGLVFLIGFSVWFLLSL